MKRIILCIAFVLSCLPLLADGPEKKPHFCIEPGTHLYYERHRAGTGQLTQTTEIFIESIEDTPDGKLVHYTLTLSRKPFGGENHLTCLIDEDGNAYMDFGAAAQSFVRNMFPKAKMTVSGTSAVMPQTFIPGETLPGARSEAVLSFCSILVEIFDREVLRHETVTTPAGTFPCAVVFFRKVEDAPFHKRDNWEEDYYTPGIGYVRHLVYGKDMKLIAVEELVRIERPQNDNLVTL